MRWGQRQGRSTGESASATQHQSGPRGAVVGRFVDVFDKEIARSVLFLGPASARQQSPANDSDTPGAS
jgi:hypothetical protein